MIPANYSTISFPSLGIEVNPGRALALGPLTIHYYGLIIAIGLMLAVVYACRRCSQFGIKQDDLLDMKLYAPDYTQAKYLGEQIMLNPAGFYGKILDAAFSNQEEPYDLSDN